VHFTPLNYTEFVINNKNHCIISPKADGVYQNIMLMDYFPFIDLYSIGKLWVESERVNNINYVFTDHSTNLKLRKLHPYTSYLDNSFYAITNINELSDALEIESKIVEKYQKETISNNTWYPKVSFELKLTDEFSFEQLKNVTINCGFPIDGWIITEINTQKSFKLKPDIHLTIDLLYNSNNIWLCRDNIQFSKYVTNSNNLQLQHNKIYRCYYDDKTKFWEAREERPEKLSPNPFKLVQQLDLYFKNPWNYDVLKMHAINNYDLQNSYYENRQYCNFKMWLPNDLKIIMHKYLFNINTVLDIGCGYNSQNIVKKYKIKNYIGIDSDINIIKNNRLGYLCNINEPSWDFQCSQFYGKNLGTFNVILAINTIQYSNNIEKFIENINYHSISNRTKLIIRFLDWDLLKINKIQEAIYINNFIKVDNKNAKLKYYYSHCHKQPREENLISGENLINKLSKNWEIIDDYTNKITIDQHPWQQYLNCFRTTIFLRR
jgi:hypothetical protein